MEIDRKHNQHHMKGHTVYALTTGLVAIGALGLTPLAIAAIGALIRHRAERRRAAMLDRFWSKL